MAAASRKNRFPISTLFEKSILGLSFIWGLLRLRRRPDAFLPFSMFQKVAGLPAAITFQVVTTLAGKPCEVTFVPIRRECGVSATGRHSHATLGRQAITPSVRALTSGEARQVATES